MATDGIEGFKADDREVKLDGLTYTIETLVTFSEDTDIFLILGADAASRLPTWERYQEVLERVTVLVVPRPGTDSTFVAEILPDAVFLDMAVLEISGTEIREMVRADRPFRFLVTDRVHSYIHDNNLYTESG